MEAVSQSPDAPTRTEAEIRTDLAAAYRLVALFGWRAFRVRIITF